MSRQGRRAGQRLRWSRIAHPRRQLRVERLEDRLLLALLPVNSTGDGSDANPGDGISVTFTSTFGDPRFFGTSPPVANSAGGLFLEEGFAASELFSWRSTDPILGAIDTGGFVLASEWNFFPGSPPRLVFEGDGGGATFFGDVLFEPFSRGVVDVVKESQRVRYLLGGESTLRSAMEEANALLGQDSITFEIPTIDPNFDPISGVYTIQPDSALPVVTDAVSIDATTQFGFSGTPIVALDGVNAGTNGYHLKAGNSTVRGQIISGFSENGILIEQKGGNVITNNWIGTDNTGTKDRGNAQQGIRIQDSPNNVIGGTGQSHNVIAGNDQYGVVIRGENATGNVVQGNLIGTDRKGMAPLPNEFAGVLIETGARSNLIGTDGDGTGDAEEGNVISGNKFNGVIIRGAGTDQNVIAGNLIGVDKEGTAALPNQTSGISIEDQAKSNRIGTDGTGTGDSEERNVISGNKLNGVRITGEGTEENIVAGNLIGTNKEGNGAVPNQKDGVLIEAKAKKNRIGTDGNGTADGEEGNVISGNKLNGVRITGGGSQENLVAGNLIGADKAGKSALPNTKDGMLIDGGATSNRIEAGNVISGNTGNGVRITGNNTNENVVSGNKIGTDKEGSTEVPNGKPGFLESKDGVLIDGGAQKNRIENGNVISGNTANGVHIFGAGTQDNVVTGNLIGTKANGTEPLPNQRDGVFVRMKATGNRIADNTISGNKLRGVRITGIDTKHNVVTSNKIGADRTGNNAVPNQQGGVLISFSARENVIGGLGAGDRNIISGNTGHGVQIGGAGGTGTPLPTLNSVHGNYIGTKIDGASELGNTADGVSIEGGATSSSIEGNLISGNKMNGVRISGTGTEDNFVVRNLIGTNGDGTQAVANGLDGVVLEGAAKASRISVNVISGNKHNGVRITGSGTDSNLVRGNLIGTRKDEKGTVPNEKNGVSIEGGAQGNVIAFAIDVIPGNVISGNRLNGVRIAGQGTKSNTVAGNFIGTKSDKTSALGNEKNGVLIEDNASSNRIGSDVDGTNDDVERNTIAFNGGDGVFVSAGTGNAIRRNSIFDNTALGIDLGTDGVTVNDSKDADTGANNLQNFPVIVAMNTGKMTDVTGMLNSTPSKQFRLEFFSNTTADPSLFGEGQTFVGAVDATTNASGIATFTVSLPASQLVTVTATDPDGNTSEFSTYVVVTVQQINFRGAGNVDIRIDANHNIGRPGNTGDGVEDIEWVFDVRDDPNTNAAWTTKQSAPAAFVRGSPLQAQVAFSVQPANVSSIVIRAANAGPYGDFLDKTVAITAGTGMATFVTGGKAVNAVDVNDITFGWNLQSAKVDGQSKPANVEIALSTHRMYTLQAAPVAPWGKSPAEAWATVLELGTRLAKAKDTPQAIATEVTGGIHESRWVGFRGDVRFLDPQATFVYAPTCAGRSRFPDGFGKNGLPINPQRQTYNLSDWMTALEAGPLAFQQCNDTANFQALLSRSLGVNVTPMFIYRTDNGKLDGKQLTTFTDTAFAAGTEVPRSYTFTFHQVGLLDGKVYDTAVRQKMAGGIIAAMDKTEYLTKVLLQRNPGGTAYSTKDVTDLTFGKGTPTNPNPFVIQRGTPLSGTPGSKVAVTLDVANPPAKPCVAPVMFPCSIARFLERWGEGVAPDARAMLTSIVGNKVEMEVNIDKGATPRTGQVEVLEILGVTKAGKAVFGQSDDLDFQITASGENEGNGVTTGFPGRDTAEAVEPDNLSGHKRNTVRIAGELTDRMISEFQGSNFGLCTLESSRSVPPGRIPPEAVDRAMRADALGLVQDLDGLPPLLHLEACADDRFG